MATQNLSPDTDRRRLLVKYLRWTLGLTAAAVFYPLLRFSGFTVKPKPQYIEVPKKISVGGVYTGREFILFVLDKGPIAVSRTCTHLGCKVNYRQEIEAIECPCHQSRFTIQGTVISGPAKKDLPKFPVTVQEDEYGEITGYVITIA